VGTIQITNRWLLRAAVWPILLSLLAPAAARAEWLRAESASFIVYSSGSEEKLRERIAKLEEFDRLLRALTATRSEPSPNKLVVYLVRNGAGMRQIAPLASSVAGFYTATPDAILAVVNEAENRGINEDDVLFHEYAHHFMLQYYPAAYPLWFSEGFAEYVMTARIEPDRIEYGNYNLARASWLADRSVWLPYEDILFGDLSRMDGARFYAQSWLLVHYLLTDRRRQAALADYMQAVGRGTDPRQAFAAAFGIEPRALRGELSAYARRITYHRLARSVAPTAPDIRVEALPASADSLLLSSVALQLDVRERDRRPLLNRIRRLAARRADPFARRVQARAELLYGDPDVAERLLDAALAEAPGDAELLYLQGLRHLVAGRRDPAVRADRFRRAQAWFARAYRANPDHVPTLFGSAESLSPSPQFLTENTRNMLLLAVQLAPQVSQLRVSAAHFLLLREQYELAEIMLLPLTASAHRSGAAPRVQELLNLARTRQRPRDSAVFRPLSETGEDR